jgi:hypothetical protein
VPNCVRHFSGHAAIRAYFGPSDDPTELVVVPDVNSLDEEGWALAEEQRRERRTTMSEAHTDD